ncbi:hypothetical protein [Candidatus Poriferisodalis sp.]|uniref:hypothetical protein n=1 Tax=Candidatus Poriferisodalis sp. TaxID=3101277 RepID=UPI003D1348E2
MGEALRRHTTSEAEKLQSAGRLLEYDAREFEASVAKSLEKLAEGLELDPDGDWIGFVLDFPN